MEAPPGNQRRHCSPSSSSSSSSPVLDVHVATTRVLLRASVLCAKNDHHTAKKTLAAHATNLKLLGARCLAKSLARGGKERHGTVTP